MFVDRNLDLLYEIAIKNSQSIIGFYLLKLNFSEEWPTREWRVLSVLCD